MPFTGQRDGGGFAGFAVRGFAALVEGAAGAHQDGQLVVEVVAVPDADAGAGLQPEHFPGVPEGLEAADGFVVLPPLRAPAVLTAERAAEDGQEVVGHPVPELVVHRLGCAGGQPAQEKKRGRSSQGPP